MRKIDQKPAPLFSKIAWGMGGLPEMLANNAILVLVYQIYNIELGLNPMWIGVALMISRILDAVTDPLMGNLTDNTRTKWGRRRPWILLGAVIMSVFFAMIWLIPPGLGQMGLFAWFATMTVLFYIGFTIFIIPFGALGLELELDYDLRTKLQVFRLFPSFAGGFVLPWLYKMTLSDCFAHETLATAVNGVRYV
ncbi:MAG: MFS transporter, partial [Verrucomicrobiota bacterium]